MRKIFTLFSVLLFALAVNATDREISNSTDLRTYYMSTAAAGDVIILTTDSADGCYEISTNDYWELTKSMTIKAATDVHPKVMLKIQPRISGEGTAVKFIGITFDGSAIVNNYDYLIRYNDSKENSLEFENCQIQSFTHGFVIMSKSGENSQGSLSLTNCTIHHTDSSLFYNRSNAFKKVIIDGCHIAKGFADKDVILNYSSAKIDECIIKDCTFDTIGNSVINNQGTIKKLDISESDFYSIEKNVITGSSAIDTLLLNDCHFYYNGVAHAVNLTAAMKVLDIKDCEFEDFKNNVIASAAVDSCKIVDCKFHDNKTAGGALSVGGAAKKIIVSGSTFKDFKGNVITTSAAVDTCEITNSKFQDNAVASAVDLGGAIKYLGIKGDSLIGFSGGTVIATSAAVDSCLLQNNFFDGGTKVIELGSAAKHLAVNGCDFSNYTGTVLSTVAVDTCKILNSSFHDNAGASAVSLSGAVKYLKINGSEFADFTGTTIATSAAVDSCDILNSTFNGGTKAIEISSKSSKSLYMNGCELSNYSNYVIHGPKATSNLAFCKIYNCYFHNCTNSAIYFEKTSSDDYHACDKLDIKYSTFANFSGFDNGLIEIYNKKETETADVELIVENCTFYNVSKTSSSTFGVVDSRKSTNNSISNCIFANPSELASGEYAHKATQMYGGTVTKCLRHNVPAHRNTPSSGNDIQGDPKFVNASSGDFHLEEGSAAIGAATDGSDLGDPRWWTYGRVVIVDRFGTICLPYGVKAGTYSGATFYSIAGKRLDGSSQPYSLVLETVSGDLKAGQPYFFEASATSLTAPYDGTPAEAGNYKGLFGTLEDLDATAMNALVGTEGKEIYLLSSNTIVKAGTGCSLAANRAYIDMAKVPEYVEPSTPAPGIREIPMTPQSGTSLQDVENAETAVKFIENGRILILRDGITYDALGRIIK